MTKKIIALVSFLALLAGIQLSGDMLYTFFWEKEVLANRICKSLEEALNYYDECMAACIPDPEEPNLCNTQCQISSVECAGMVFLTPPKS